MTSIPLLLLSIIPADLVAAEHVDTVERNWVTNCEGTQLYFCQLLFCDIDLRTGERRIRAWRIIDCDRGEYEGFAYAAVKRPYLGKRMIWDDRGTLRDMTVGYTEETITPYDPEVLAQADWPKEWRRDISTIKRASRVRGRR